MQLAQCSCWLTCIWDEAHNTQYDILILKFIDTENGRSWSCLNRDGYSTRTLRLWRILHQVWHYWLKSLHVLQKPCNFENQLFSFSTKDTRVLQPGLLIKQKMSAIESEFKAYIWNLPIPPREKTLETFSPMLCGNRRHRIPQ